MFVPADAALSCAKVESSGIGAPPLIIPVAMCGGAGKRLWPLSREPRPKQFLSLTAEHTLFQAAALRTSDRGRFAPLIVISGCDHRFIVAEQLRAIGVSAGSIVLEPFGRGTLPAAIVAALVASRVDPDALILLMPADHVISDNVKFLAAVEAGALAAAGGAFVLFGVPPRSPRTSYGYIEVGSRSEHDGVRKVTRFIEKPPREVAERSLAAGNFVWNSGIFLLPAKAFLAEAERLAPDAVYAVTQALDRAAVDADFIRLDACFGSAPSASIDRAVMERTDLACVVPVDMAWMDLGCWSALYEIAPKDASGNVTLGNVISENTSNSYLRSEGPLVATIGLDDLIVVATADVVIVAGKAHDQHVDRLVDRLRQDTPERP